jgi:hypothetical protein
MSTPVLRMITGLLLAVLSSSCVASRRPAYWSYWQLHSKADQTTQPTILLDLQKETLPLPVPAVLWLIGSRQYQLTLDFLTSTMEYQQFDSIQYQLRTTQNQVLTAGTLPFRRGEVNKVPFEPSMPSLPVRYLIRCTTPARIPLSKQRQPLMGTFLIYAKDRNGQPALVPVDQVPLRYYEARISTIF